MITNLEENKLPNNSIEAALEAIPLLQKAIDRTEVGIRLDQEEMEYVVKLLWKNRPKLRYIIPEST